ncbi:uncharacterized protein LOC125198004 [Salvia hispanica]|uniref:uncharacterized protein LOC125198004 n=1 Tax=Salvia hispanica TaxID=49212 RepID=UPI0020092B6C|nr:uncharacterized protein LOC125198004 [Salvia hispanica]
MGLQGRECARCELASGDIIARFARRAPLRGRFGGGGGGRGGFSGRRGGGRFSGGGGRGSFSRGGGNRNNIAQDGFESHLCVWSFHLWHKCEAWRWTLSDNGLKPLSTGHVLRLNPHKPVRKGVAVGCPHHLLLQDAFTISSVP